MEENKMKKLSLEELENRIIQSINELQDHNYDMSEQICLINKEKYYKDLYKPGNDKPTILGLSIKFIEMNSTYDYLIVKGSNYEEYEEYQAAINKQDK